MLDFRKIRERIQVQLDCDRLIQTVETEGPSLEAAVEEAATLLGTSVHRIDFEVIVKGARGFLGQGAKLFKINAYIRSVERDDEDDDAELDEAIGAQSNEKVIDLDGEVFVQLRMGDVFVKITAPSGNGAAVAEKTVDAALRKKRIGNYDLKLVQAAVAEQKGEYTRVATFVHNVANDAFVRVEISEDEMKAWVTVTPPGIGGADVTYDTFLKLIRNNGVIYGIREEFLERFADRPAYGEKTVAAQGLPPRNGMDAYMEYFFDVDPSRVRLQESRDGSINFKELNLIQNVRQGDKLAKKIPAEKGIAGRTVMGKMLNATDGKDTIIPIGANSELATDGITLIAKINGQVLLMDNKINVSPIYEIQGSVGPKTGNIEFLGSVSISGNVDEGFSVKATGNIEIRGNVNKAMLDAEGDIIVRQGINGKDGVIVRSDRSIWAKFVENAHIKAGEMVIVSSGIINSNVDAQKRIVCQGKRARITGGRMRAAEEIIAKDIGSPSGNTETICEVGYDPATKEREDALQARVKQLQEELDDILRNTTTLESIKKQRKELPPDKEDYLNELLEKRNLNVAEMNAAKTDLLELRSYLNSLKTHGRVSVSAAVYAGTVVYIHGIKESVRDKYKAVTFSLEDGLIRVGAYKDMDEETKNAMMRKE